MTRTLLGGSPVQRLRLLSRHLAPLSRSSTSPFPTPTTSRSSLLLHRSLASSSAAADSAAAASTTWTFTTSAAFHGKPVSRSRRSGPEGTTTSSTDSDHPSRSRRHSVQQGLAPDHPLCKWRDQHLAEGKAPKEIGAGHDWWFVEGVPSSAAAAGGGTRGVVLGVAGASEQDLFFHDQDGQD
jgi:protein phosphatase PTC7